MTYHDNHTNGKTLYLDFGTHAPSPKESEFRSVLDAAWTMSSDQVVMNLKVIVSKY
ncbi:unnamed protein product [Leptidea sinapis]|uniref:Uncharacterized protein n=1 Tax=Leptidea sinapis TaxID=189913 RepID=A0A5E4QNJ2_9NEOP|nr:unnamed protein product [Leptidea sinapis]